MVNSYTRSIDYIFHLSIISDRERPPAKELKLFAHKKYFYGYPWMRLASLNNNIGKDNQTNYEL